MVNKKTLFTGILSLLFLALMLLVGQNIYLTILLGVYIFALFSLLLNAEGNYFMIFYLCAFFIFLIGRIVATTIFHMPEKAYAPAITEEAKNITCLALTISIVSLMAGYRVKTHTFSTRIKGLPYDVSDEYMTGLRIITKYLFCLVEFVVILESLERAIYSQAFGYFESYISYNSRIPYVIRMLADIEPVILASFLATMPTKKEMRLPFIVFIIGLIANAIGGKRYPLVSGVLLILLYCLYRNQTDNEQWIKRRTLLFGFLSFPAIIILLQFMSSWRLGNTASYNNPIAEFMYSIGGSGYLIGYSDMYHEELASHGVIYSFGRLWKLVFANPITKDLFSTAVYSNQTAENAMYGHSFADTITYLLRRNAFLSGYGMGSSYIAELFTDFSYPGVILGNIFIGTVIKQTKKMERNHLVKNFLCIFIALLMLRIPRDSFDYFLVEFVGVKNIITMIVLNLCARQYERNVAHKKRLTQTRVIDT